ncbi:peptidase S41 [Aquimarina sp. TRL1]|uniref:S41 family peptidase n=1 Tax=Aquimarina sp. (strain TRL1) TaxID=2736252 RepID=UPI00158D878A|nr:S41 family peptidase [Aquimarina sp. TRL1]QKX05815.1 peptidase S41 [Aquimarina sp. TRL1]
MKKLLAFLTLLVISVGQSKVLAQETPQWMRYPVISPDGKKIAFSYKGDIYVVNSAGGRAVQLTTNMAHDYRPVWSHDAQKIAFSSDRHGNFDVYIMDAEGGNVQRLTHHSANDYVSDFSVDNKKVYYTSTRLDTPVSIMFPSRTLSEIYSVSVQGGREQQFLAVPSEHMKWNATGDQFLFENIKGYEDQWRKHHTSSITRDIVLYDTNQKAYKKIANWEGEERNPVWNGQTGVYFLSEKGGSFNIWKKDINSNTYGTQITEHTTHPVRFLSASKSGVLCYGYDGEIYTYQNGSSKKVNITIKSDQPNNLYEFINAGRITDFDVSPNGKEVAFIARGEVFVTSITYKTTKQITKTSGMERRVQFSPDGKSLVYDSERDGSWNIYKATIGRKEDTYFYNSLLINEEVLVATDQETFQPLFSPDGKEVAFLENRTTLKVVNLASKEIRTVLDGTYNYSYVDGDQYFTWSPDSKWLLVEFFEFERWNSDIGLVKASGTEKPINLTKSGYSNTRAKFAMDGALVYWETDKQGFRSHGSWGSHGDVYGIFLTQKAYDTFLQSKEETELEKEEDTSEKEEGKDKKENKKKKKDKEDKEEKVRPIVVEKEGLHDRKLRLTIHSSFLGDYLLNEKADQLVYLSNFEKGFDLWTTKFKEKETKLLAKLNGSGSKLQFDKKQEHVFLINKGSLQKIAVKDGSKKSIGADATMSLSKAKERAYMFEHAWRQLREKFYVQDLHGVDWDMYKKEYEKYLPSINNGYDFAEMLSELLGEINASHTGAGYRRRAKKADKTASLGCFYDETYTGNGVKIAEIITGSPLQQKESKITAGTIIEKINGETITANTNFYALLNRKEGKRTLLACYNPTSKERWSEVVKPVSLYKESQLAYKRWVKSRAAAVEKLSGGRLGYVHVKGMNSASFREVFEKALGEFHTKEGLIVDTRFNGGGWLHDDLVTFLGGKVYMTFEPRGQKNMGGEPIWKWTKPSCVLMSESNYSDAHMFPYTYKALGVGKLIGMPVPGTGTAVWWDTMVDGQTTFGIPQVGMRGIIDNKLLENNQLMPDIQVDNVYEKALSGEDQQLEAAVKELLK